MTGSNYILSQQAFRMLHEAVSPLQFAKFEQQQQHHQIYSLSSTTIQDIKNSFNQTYEHEEIKIYHILQENNEFITMQNNFDQTVRSE